MFKLSATVIYCVSLNKLTQIYSTARDSVVLVFNDAAADRFIAKSMMVTLAVTLDRNDDVIEFLTKRAGELESRSPVLIADEENNTYIHPDITRITAIANGS